MEMVKKTCQRADTLVQNAFDACKSLWHKLTHNNWFFTIRQFRQWNRSQLVMMSFVFALLLMFLHVFLLASQLTNNAATGVKEKLWVYFYIKDANQVSSGVTEQQLAARVISFKDSLEHWGARVKYYSKEDALKNLQSRLPNMVGNFDEYGIENPLPATLYVSFTDQKQYDYVMEAKNSFEDILLTKSTANAKEQFSRNARLINLLGVLQFFFLFIVLACVVVILVFLGMIIKTKFAGMHHSINVQKLLWSPFLRLKKPFFLNIVFVFTIAYIITLILSAILLSNLSSVFPYLFGMELKEVFNGTNGFNLSRLFIEFILLLFISIVYANRELSRLLKKD